MKTNKIFTILTLFAAFFSGMFNRFKDGFARISSTTKGGTNDKYIEWMKGKTFVSPSRMERYSGHKKYHKVPTIQN